MLELNKIHCGDCLEVMNDFPDNSVVMTLTDIPYGEVNKRPVGGGLRIIKKGLADILTFNLEYFVVECCRVTSGSVYIFCGIEQVSEIRKTMVLHGLSTRLCVYEKKNPSPMNGDKLWLSSIECCVFGRKANATFNYNCKGSVWRFNSGTSKKHPTEKNLRLFEYLIEASTDKGDLVFDPCLGSGTTALAAANTNRNFICVEKQEVFADMAKIKIKTAEPQLF